MKLLSCVIVVLLYSSIVCAGPDVATLNLKTYSSPPSGYTCNIMDLSSREQVFGTHREKQGCNVVIRSEQFEPKYTVCMLSGITHLPENGLSSSHSCRVQTVGGIWQFSSNTESGSVDCSFLCIKKPAR